MRTMSPWMTPLRKVRKRARRLTLEETPTWTRVWRFWVCPVRIRPSRRLWEALQRLSP
ncbi:hypothetical protein PHMEG_00016359, partial [Phytophthora megakarya]